MKSGKSIAMVLLVVFMLGAIGAQQVGRRKPSPLVVAYADDISGLIDDGYSQRVTERLQATYGGGAGYAAVDDDPCSQEKLVEALKLTRQFLPPDDSEGFRLGGVRVLKLEDLPYDDLVMHF